MTSAPSAGTLKLFSSELLQNEALDHRLGRNKQTLIPHGAVGSDGGREASERTRSCRVDGSGSEPGSPEMEGCIWGRSSGRRRSLSRHRAWSGPRCSSAGAGPSSQRLQKEQRSNPNLYFLQRLRNILHKVSRINHLKKRTMTRAGPSASEVRWIKVHVKI